MSSHRSRKANVETVGPMVYHHSMIEEWRPVLGYEGAYEVSNLGQVRSLDRWITHQSRYGTTVERPVKGRVLKQPRGSDRYPAVKIAGRTRHVHALVAEAFIGPRSPGMEVCHADGSRDNNQVSNLRYDTRTGNVADAMRHGTAWGARLRAERYCPNGHEYTPENTGQRLKCGRSYRVCRACDRARASAYRLRKAEAASYDILTQIEKG